VVMIENLMVHYTDQENICGISHSSALLKEYVIADTIPQLHILGFQSWKSVQDCILFLFQLLYAGHPCPLLRIIYDHWLNLCLNSKNLLIWRCPNC
jgi:hypothetical protein